MLLRSALFRTDFLSESSDDPSLGGPTANIEMTSSPGRPGLTNPQLSMLHTVVAVEDHTLTLNSRPEHVSIREVFISFTTFGTLKKDSD